jgi:hypothetical protein
MLRFDQRSAIAALNCALHLARREIFHYDVTQESPDRFVGFITDESDRLVVGASNEIFDVPAQWVQHPETDW